MHDNATQVDTRVSAEKKAEKISLLAPLAIALSLLAIAGAGYGYEQIRQMQAELLAAKHATQSSTISDTTEALDKKIRRVEKSIDAITQRIDTLHNTIADLSIVAEPVPDAKTKAALEELKKELDHLETGMREKLLALESHVQETASDLPDNNTLLQLSYQLLRADVLSGRSYAHSLKQFRDLLPKPQASRVSLRTLEQHQHDGILTKAALYHALKSITLSPPLSHPHNPDVKESDASALQDAPAPSKGLHGAWQRMKNNLSSLIRIERINENDSSIDKLHKAQTTLMLGDVHHTIEILRELPQSDRRLFKVWMEDARTRLRVIDALHRIGVRIVSSSPTTSPSEP